MEEASDGGIARYTIYRILTKRRDKTAKRCDGMLPRGR
jgi:hypothetical protein